MVNEHRSTSRILDILEMLASATNGYTLTEIARQIDAPKSSIFPILHTMLERHYVSLDSNSGRYSIGVSTFAVGSTYMNSKSLLSHLNAGMNELVDVCNETCSMGVLDGSNVLYVSKIDSPQSLRLVTRVGKRIPANCTALGKALLSRRSYDELKEIFPEKMSACTKYSITNLDKLYSEIEKVELNGFAYENQEFAEQILCIAVPISRNGNIVAAISVSIPSFRYDEKKLEIVKSELKKLKLRAELILRNYNGEVSI
ncbi:MAG: IclR family transcriptional regulator [Clostridia bacterium]|jgi:DNA-binding IclR family transcriptional regulator|nr:IclR family transcriptional regulator [Clostridia bacterium]MCI1959141.1 IclR family transcriptional regulator [Clostridia bacterium]MCI2000250.1 IclR family transcriptional regulator [Clostridia bacterium]MCI2014585.1 IclR family transcriptional regulator [Clostridia bacterium]